MTPKEMWQAYKKINPEIGDEIDAWAFGSSADELADLVLRGEKTATASAYELYKLENEPLPQVGTFDVILDSRAFKEGEADKSLAYWQQVHEAFFTECLAEAGLEFSQETGVVLEEFRKVYPLEQA